MKLTTQLKNQNTTCHSSFPYVTYLIHCFASLCVELYESSIYMWSSLLRSLLSVLWLWDDPHVRMSLSLIPFHCYAIVHCVNALKFTYPSAWKRKLSCLHCFVLLNNEHSMGLLVHYVQSYSGALVFKLLKNVIFWTLTINVFCVYNKNCTHMGTHTWMKQFMRQKLSLLWTMSL